MEDAKIAYAESQEARDFYAKKYLRESLVQQLIPILGYEGGAKLIIENAEKLEAYILQQ